jgi:hypothetical protein
MAMTQLKKPSTLPLLNSSTNSSTPLTRKACKHGFAGAKHAPGEACEATEVGLTDVNNSDIHAKALAGEISDVAHVVTPIEDGNGPMEDCCPDGGPTDKLRIDRDIVNLYNVVDGKVE